MKLTKWIMYRSVCFTFLVLLSFSGHVFAQRAFFVFNDDGQQVGFDQIVHEARTKSYVFFGELHNNPISHWLQLELTKALFENHGERLIIGMEMFEEITQMVEGHKGKNMMEAQAIKDATMSHFILKNSSRKNVFLHLNGSYHSDRKEGIVNFLSRDIPRRKILTITTVTQDQIDQFDEENQQLADFIIVVDSDMTKTY